MQIKTIAKTISTKLTEWLKTITDESLRKEVRDNLLVSGGSITSLLLNEPINDYDIYLQDISVLKRLVEYYIKGCSSIVLLDGREKEKLQNKLDEDYKDASGDEDGSERNNSYAISLRNLKEDQIKLYMGGAGLKVNETIPEAERNYIPLYFSPNAISLSNDIQIVIRFHGTPEQIHKTFDFVHATNYFTFKEGLVRNLPAIESILTKQLRYQGSHYPVTSIIRSKKFVKRLWNINAGELLKIIYQCSLLDLNDPDVMEEQIIGVDVAYFEILVNILRGKRESEPGFAMTSDYLNEIIDRVFNNYEESD